MEINGYKYVGENLVMVNDKSSRMILENGTLYYVTELSGNKILNYNDNIINIDDNLFSEIQKNSKNKKFNVEINSYSVDLVTIKQNNIYSNTTSYLEKQLNTILSLNIIDYQTEVLNNLKVIKEIIKKCIDLKYVNNMKETEILNTDIENFKNQMIVSLSHIDSTPYFTKEGIFINDLQEIAKQSIKNTSEIINLNYYNNLPIRTLRDAEDIINIAVALDKGQNKEAKDLAISLDTVVREGFSSDFNQWIYSPEPTKIKKLKT